MKHWIGDDWLRINYVFTITQDYLKPWLLKPMTPERQRWLKLQSAIGRVQPIDIGKRVYEVKSPSGYSFYQVENDSQLQARLAR